MTSGSPGIIRNTSVILINISSIAPSQYPEIKPISVPTVTASIVAKILLVAIL